MKLSEYRADRALFWVGSPTPDEPIKTLIDRDVRAVEAVGYKWDPEEVPLPERLYVVWDGAGIPYLSPSDPGSPFGTDERRDAAYLAAAGSYNAKPELRHIAANLLDNDGSSTKLGERLLAILDGKETP